MSTESEPIRSSETTPSLLRRPFMWLQRFLHWALGDRPGAYWVIILWIALFLALRDFFISQVIPTRLFTDTSSAYDGIAMPSLPLAIVAAVMHWIVTRPTALGLRRKAVITALAIVAAGAIYLLPPLSASTGIKEVSLTVSA